jgi:hypothetical protein
MENGLIDCVICLKNFQVGDQIYLLENCHHMCHHDCILTYSQTHPDMCPVCDYVNRGLVKEYPATNTDCECPYCRPLVETISADSK